MQESSEHPIARRLPFHYGWAIVAAGSVGVFACLGLGRFALGMLLPSMGLSLDLSRSQMGWISTANFVGYMAAVMLGGRMTRRWSARQVIVSGLLLIAVSMIAVSRAQGFGQILVLYLLTGYGSGAVNVPVMGLIAHWFGRRLRGRAAGCVAIGSGMAIVTAGILVPAINASFGVEGWRVAWLVIGLMVLAAALVDLLVLRNNPAELGLEPVTGAPAAEPGGSAPVCTAAPPPAVRRRILAHLGAVYAAFGFTYVIYATFIVTALVQERGFPESTAGVFWSWIGFLSLASGPVFGALSDRFGRRAGLMIVFACQAVSYLLVALPLPGFFLYVSIAMFGLTVWAIPSIMAAAVGDYVGPEQAVAAFGAITLAFALGQIVGPAVAGWMADSWNSFSGAFGMAAAMAALGLAGAAFLPRPARG